MGGSLFMDFYLFFFTVYIGMGGALEPTKFY